MRLILAALLVLGAQAQTLQQRVESLIRTSPRANRAFWGIRAANLGTGRLLVSLNADRLFRPASNAKLFTMAFALMRLGPDYRFRTRVLASNPPDAQGRIAGDLVLMGGGDPTLTGRPVPYLKESPAGDLLAPIEELAGRVFERGVRVIDGDIVGDDTRYTLEPYPDGWTLDDSLWDYGAPVSALAVHENFLVLILEPGPDPDGPPALTLAPPVEYYAIDNRVRWAPGLPEKIVVTRTGDQIRLTGTMPAGMVRLGLAIDDPALYAAVVLRDALIRRGITVRGAARARHRAAGELPEPAPQAVELAARTSPPLSDVLQVIGKVSQNLYAEMVMREAAFVRRGSGSLDDALRERDAFLSEVGIAPDEYELRDASGLARQNLVSPAAVVRLLEYMHSSRHRDAWLALMPVGGVDGTLETRFPGQPAGPRVRAKTGTLTAVSGLSGYAERATGGRVVFSILVNNYDAPASEIRGLVDRVAVMFTGPARPPSAGSSGTRSGPRARPRPGQTTPAKRTQSRRAP